MNNENLFWKVISIIVVLLTAVVPAYVAYDLHSFGPVPEKHIQLEQWPPINALRDISPGGIKIKLTLDDKFINNLFTSQATIRNIGNAPVLPSDYKEKLNVTVNDPWQIVNVSNTFSNGFVQFHWKKVNNTKFEAEPALLNPGDIVMTTLYITNTKLGSISTSEKPSEAHITW